MAMETASDQTRALDDLAAYQSATLQSCRIELPLDLLDEQGSLLDWVIGLAFDALGAHHLDLRIVTAAGYTNPT